MNTEQPTPPKRRIVVRMTAREKADPVAVMSAVRNALSGHGVTLVVRTVEGNKLPAPEQPPAAPTVSDEPLETKARELAQAVLDTAAAKAEKETSAEKRDAALMHEEIAAARRGAGAFMLHWCARGVRITVEIYQMTAGTIADAVGGLLGGKKGN